MTQPCFRQPAHLKVFVPDIFMLPLNKKRRLLLTKLCLVLVLQILKYDNLYHNYVPGQSKR